MNKEKAVFVTGASGALGMALIPRLLEVSGDAEVYCLLRPSAQNSPPQERLTQLQQVLGLTPQMAARLRCVPGDTTLPLLGLTREDWDNLADKCGQIFHLAASVDFTLPLADSRRQNVDASQNIIELARRAAQRHGNEFRLNYVSTAYVCGKRHGPLLEAELNPNEVFYNSYEQSKAEAEALVQALATELQFTVYRPSQIIGNSLTGRIDKFFGFYEFVALGARGRSNVLVADRAARPDMVASDYVCDALLHLAAQPDTIGRTFHLAAGLQASLSVDAVVDSVVSVLRSHPRGLPNIVRPHIVAAEALQTELSASELRAFDYSPQKLLLRSYAPYLAHDREFDVASTHQRLAAAGIVIADMRSVIERTTAYALDSRQSRAQARTAGLADTAARQPTPL